MKRVFKVSSRRKLAVRLPEVYSDRYNVGFGVAGKIFGPFSLPSPSLSSRVSVGFGFFLPFSFSFYPPFVRPVC